MSDTETIYVKVGRKDLEMEVRIGSIPRIGETINIDDGFYKVTNVIHEALNSVACVILIAKPTKKVKY